jgi:hypothetical protein
MRWLYIRDLFDKGGIPIETYDNLTAKRISRLIKLQEERLKERQKAIEKQREEQERRSKSEQRKASASRKIK